MKTKENKKILVIFGSPRRGNSYKATKRFEEELKKLGSYEFEFIFLDKVNLEFCKGCHNCLFVGEDKCPNDDLGRNIYAQMLKSDGLVFVSPVYVINVSGLMKNFIDRMCFICHRPALFNQDVMIISSVGAIGLKRTLKYMKEVCEVWGARTITTLGLTTPPNVEALNEKNSKQIRKAADSYHAKFSKSFRPTFNQLMQFEMQREIFTSELGRSISPADYEHYMKLKDEKFNVPARINPLKRIFVKILKRFVLIFI